MADSSRKKRRDAQRFEENSLTWLHTTDIDCTINLELPDFINLIGLSAMKDAAFEGPLFSEKSATIEEIVSRFEEVWQIGKLPQIEEYLSIEGELRFQLLVELVYTDIEFRSKRKESPRIETYLQQFPELGRQKESLLDLVVQEFRCRKSVEPDLTIEGYQDRFPEFAELFLQKIEQLDTSPKRSTNRSLHSTFVDPNNRRDFENEKSDRSLPSRIGRFDLISSLGEGAFGSVMLAYDPQLDREVALKIPRVGVLVLQEDVDRFLREGRAAAQLRHPHIVPVFESGEVSGTYYIASGYVEGRSLRQELAERKRFSAEESAKLVSHLASALDYAHSRGIVHRDIKPENIMFDANEEPVILDFGLARREEGDLLKTREGILMGTLPYMSPEQAKGKAHLADGRSDLWSLGVVLYELLTGKRPYTGDFDEILIGIRQNEPKPLRQLDSSVSKDLEAICLKCLNKKPEDRYASCGELAEDLQRWLRGEATHARPIGQIERFRRWCRRNPVVASLSCAVVVTLLIGSVVSTYFAIETNIALAEATDANNLKDQALEETHKTIDNYYNTVQNAQLLKEKRFKPLLKELLKEALVHYGRFIEEHEHDNSRLTDLADAVFRVAVISAESGDVEKAIEAYRRVIDLQEKLIEENPSVTEFQKRLADSYQNIGSLFHETGDFQEALEALQKAQSIQKKLVREDTSNMDYPNGLAKSHNNMATIFRETGKPSEALDAWKKALEIWTQLAKKNPANTEIQNNMATIHGNIGLFLLAIGKPDQALESLRSALTIREQLVLEKPTIDNYRFDLASIYVKIGVLFHNTGQPDKALELYRKAQVFQERLVQENPTVTEYQSELALSHNNIGLLFAMTGKQDDALGSWRKAVTIWERLVNENPTIPEYRRHLANSFLSIGTVIIRTGKPDEALQFYKKTVAIQEKLAEENPKVTQYRSDLALSYINIGLLLGASGKPDQALESLQKALIVRKRIVEENPAVTDYRKELADSYFSLGSSQEANGNHTQAIRDYRDALAIQERLVLDHPKIVRYRFPLTLTLNNLGWLLGTSPVSHLRNGESAVLYATRACELTDWKNVDTIGTLACAFAEAGDFENAVKRIQQVILLSTDEKTKTRYRARLELFKASEPYRETLQKTKKQQPNNKQKKKAGIKKKNSNKPLIAPRPKVLKPLKK